MSDFNPEMLILAREARGLSQDELAEKMNIQQGTLSKIENGVMDASEHIESIYQTLNYPRSFFFREGRQFEVSPHYYRKKVKIPKKEFAKVRAVLNVLHLNIEKLLQAIELPKENLPKWDVVKNGSPTDYAQHIRYCWRIPKGRIDNLAKIVEDNGIIVFHVELGAAALDGLSLYTGSNQAIIFLNKSLPGDRMRFTLAHELAHLGLHFAQPIDTEKRDVEKEASEFASELLVPANEVAHQLFKLNLEKLADLKRYWKVSMGSLLYKAEALQIITKNQSRYLWSQFGTLGYLKQEPLELQVPVERPTLVKEITDAYLNELAYSAQELAEILCLNVDDFENYYLEQKVRLKVLSVNRA